GRGKSDYDRKASNYNLQVELADVLSVLTALDIGRAAFVGTSRGGILTMLLAAARPTAIAGCVLNDIGPVIELEGLVRIKTYVGKLPQHWRLPTADDALQVKFGCQRHKWSGDELLTLQQRTFKCSSRGLVPYSDQKLATVVTEIDPAW